MHPSEYAKMYSLEDTYWWFQGRRRIVAQMLDQIADRVTSLIFAPPEMADRFDEYGCLKPEAWQDATVELSDDQIEVVDGPADQAAAVVRWMAELDAALGPKS